MGNRLLTICFVSMVFVNCGGGGGGGAPAESATAQLFKTDMSLLNNDSQFSAKPTDNQTNGAITKAFGGTTSSDIYRFIDARVKHVYSFDETLRFTVDIFSNNKKVYSGTLKSLMGEDATNSGPLNVAGANIGAGLAMAAYSEDLDMKINLPTGTKDVGSFRLGLVALTKYYSVIRTQHGELIPVPLEGRVSILVHEGRHSDCPKGFSASDCGFMHRECTSGPAAGYPACDNSYWGPYALGGLYLKSALTKYRSGTKDHLIIQSMMDDSFSRLTEDQMDALSTTTPLLNSF